MEGVRVGVRGGEWRVRVGVDGGQGGVGRGEGQAGQRRRPLCGIEQTKRKNSEDSI